MQRIWRGLNRVTRRRVGWKNPLTAMAFSRLFFIGPILKTHKTPVPCCYGSHPCMSCVLDILPL